MVINEPGVFPTTFFLARRLRESFKRHKCINFDNLPRVKLVILCLSQFGIWKRSSRHKTNSENRFWILIQQLTLLSSSQKTDTNLYIYTYTLTFSENIEFKDLNFTKDKSSIKVLRVKVSILDSRNLLWNQA